jgi:ketosteroid isomerase-like protein
VCLCLFAGQALAATADADIAAFEKQLEAGLAARDRKILEPLLAEGFAWVHGSDGRIDDREAWLANAARGMALSGQRIERSEHEVQLAVHGDHTAIRIARVRLLDGARKRETWLRQTHTLIRNASGRWQLVMGQGVVMYEGPALDPALHARYAGTYVLDDGRKLLLEWREPSLLAVFPGGARTQIFLASPAEEVVRNPAAGSLRFSLAADGAPQAASLVRGGEEIWRAKKR